jgi:heptosyltransferase II
VYLGALAPLELGAVFDPRPRLARPAPLIERSGGELLIGVSPGATHATKRWPIDRFAALTRSLATKFPHARFVAIGGEGDRALLEHLRAFAHEVAFHPLDVAKLDVTELLRAIASLDLMISVDTGPAHLAAAIGVKTVAIFGPTSTVRWGPRGDEHRVVSLGLDCAPCSNMGGEACPRPDRAHACLEELAVERVEGAVLELLRGSAA